jgi:hypothetical protein
MPSTVEGAGQQPSKAHPADITKRAEDAARILVGRCDRAGFQRARGNCDHSSSCNLIAIYYILKVVLI